MSETTEQSDGRATPHEHAVATGNHGARGAGRGTRVASVGGRAAPASTYSWQHNAAAQLHGWPQHEHHAGAPIRLTREDYELALAAAEAPDPAGEYEPHEAALSEHKGKG